MKQVAALALLFSPAVAFAALPAGVDAAITGAGADAATALGAIIVVAVGIWALRKIVGLFGR